MSTILIKKNDTSGHIPASGDLTNDSGGAEIAVNTADGKLYTKNSAGEIVELIKQKMKKVLFSRTPPLGWCLLGWITASQRCVVGVGEAGMTAHLPPALPQVLAATMVYSQVLEGTQC